MTERKESKPISPYKRIYPEWFDGKHLNEVLFCSEFLCDHPMKSISFSKALTTPPVFRTLAFMWATV